MSVKIRLQRGGRKALPVYSIVVADSRAARDSKFIERLGHYAPKAKGAEVPFAINAERLAHWVGVGAQTTEVVARLLVKNAVGPESVRSAFTARKALRIKMQTVIASRAEKRAAAKAAKEAAAEAAANTPAPEVAATPAPEAAAEAPAA
jgi:small subunit ribosomal protein S16